MTQATDDKPTAVTNAGCEVLTPDQPRLRQALVPARANDEDPVMCAERALAQLTHEFGGWMQEECARLDAARRQVRQAGLNGANREILFRVAHDLKGNAAILGYPAVAPAADSLCRLLEHAPALQDIPLFLIEQLVDAIRAIVREHGRAESTATAAALNKRLSEVTEEFLAWANRHRPEYLQANCKPPPPPGKAS